MAKLILVVDDSAAIRQSITFILNQEGFQTVEAVDGLDGLAKLAAAERFDCVITDVNMPNLDGIGFIRQARGNPKFKFTPILVLTTESQGSKMNEGKEAGATGWIVKPFSADKLMAVVKKVVE
ncbi:MAG: two-component system response regulator [Spirochaetes bacterium GWD1_61_31]|nr:MAG: two-component system response regulator [Spirochaetes bacterium GWB1_60_80]OHD30573.1 MAG: two-component system response regulator [Spirochaetes bacterium GWC1_61_12]OHD34841.1 MAG: two-component system response regulator [Spirochaetes bacterium GWD1_61_31]OHD46687.1 MAG: two-component system response regulator [Spirochaetes bacterium GWE1_60_18]OHD60316.1 MAG: two-component system response regulator [Spirochaetes bacterium GWF1_60_12]HAP44214.1 two-component system response regulator 